MGCGCAGVMPPPQYGGSTKKRSKSQAQSGTDKSAKKQKAGSSQSRKQPVTSSKQPKQKQTKA